VIIAMTTISIRINIKNEKNNNKNMPPNVCIDIYIYIYVDNICVFLSNRIENNFSSFSGQNNDYKLSESVL
jgi:hypothetical protein